MALEADDSMVIAGGISPGKASGQEGQLRTVATVLDLDGARLAIVACDVLMLTRKTLDPVVARIEQETGIPAAHVLINCTHTHHAPSTMRVHDYDLDPVFTARVAAAAAESVRLAHERLAPARFQFHSGVLTTVGQNSRQLLDDGQIYWIGPRTNFVRPTGPFDPEFAVLAFRDAGDRLQSVIFNHSTHSIGTRSPGRRSPSIYGMAAQEVEAAQSGVVTFLEGASGSTHNLDLGGDECIVRIRAALEDGLAHASNRPVASLRALKRPLSFRVRHFDEAAEEAAVARYCRKYAPGYSEVILPVFRRMRSELAPLQGQERQTWVQVMRIGEVAIVGVPAEYFTQLGLDIKNRSPFRQTIVAELAND